ncbi:MAG: hypothetical protein LKI04_23075, partial [Paenibacillus lautus]|jgi:hypothetical protein|uniref:hypothetical protein n=1 Tax=Paenibacillus lautus TaxID=1401 RepID=UPI0026EE55D6
MTVKRWRKLAFFCEHLENSSEARPFFHRIYMSWAPRKVFGISIEAQAPLCGAILRESTISP